MTQQRDFRTAPYTAADFDAIRESGVAGPPEEGAALVIANNCHPRRGLLLAYSGGVMHVLCGKCRAVIGSFALAAGALPPIHCASCDGHSCPDAG